MRTLYLAEITRLDAQIAAMENALKDYNSPEKLAERETAREQAWGKEMMTEFGNGDTAATSWLSSVRKHAGDRAWLFEEAELEADGYQKFTAPDGKTAWRLKNPDS